MIFIRFKNKYIKYIIVAFLVAIIITATVSAAGGNIVTIQADKDTVIIGNPITFTVTCNNGDYVRLTTFGTGQYSNTQVTIGDVALSASKTGSYTWYPRSDNEPGRYCQWRCENVHLWRNESVQLTTFMHMRKGCGNAETGGLFHDTRFASPGIEHQSNIAEDRTSP
jgi:hypothetical protein